MIRWLVWTGLLGAVVVADDLGDHPGFAHAMEVETRRVDGQAVVFQYGEVRPDFEDRRNDEGQQRASLDGEWEFRFDPTQVGERDSWATDGGGEWMTVTVPHCWDVMDGGRFWDRNDTSAANPPFYSGAGWYRKELMVEPEAGKRYRFEFFGVRERAVVFVNGTEVARHEGLGAPFTVDVTGGLRSGRNTVALKVLRLPTYVRGGDGEWREARNVHTPHPKAPDYWPYAGMMGSAALVEEGLVTIRKVLVRGGHGNLGMAAVMENKTAKPVGVTLEASSPVFVAPVSTPLRLEPGAVRVVKLLGRLEAGTPRWSPARPALHDLEVRLREGQTVLDRQKLRYGVKDFRALEDRLYLNSRPVFLKGVAMYGENGKSGGSLTRDEHRVLFRLAKDSGSNFIRLQVHQRDPAVYQLADELGFLVTGEWGGFWYEEKSMGAQTRDRQSIYQSMGRCAVWDLMNHASMGLWCIHNESHQFCPEYESFVKMGRELVRELDGGMLPVTWAAWHPHKGQPHFEHADVVGFNEYRGAMDAFEDLEPDMKRVTRENPGKPLIILENGAWSTKGDLKKERWQAGLLERQWEVLDGHRPPLAGYTYWLLTDYRSRKDYTARKKADGWSAMGIYSKNGEPKLVRDVFRKLR